MSFIGIKEHNGLCWMCSIDKANSREHKYKQSDVKSFMNIVGNSVIMIEGRKKQVNGSDSPLLKYSQVICNECNNQKSKTIDNAYDAFSKEYIRILNKNISEIVFQCISEKMNVYRFLTKNFCCRLSENNLDISQDLIDFVNCDIQYPQRLVIEVYSNSEEKNFFKKYMADNNAYSDIALLGRGSLILYSSSNNREEIDIVYSSLKCNNIIFEFFYVNQDLNLQSYYERSRIKLIQYVLPKNIVNRINGIIESYV